MNIKVFRAVKQPFTGGNWPMNLAIGAAITLFAALIGQFGMLGGIAKFALTALTAGYALRVMSNEVGSNEGLLPVLPEWSDWRDLFLNGITMTFVNSIYTLVFATAVGLLGTVFGAGAAMQSMAANPSMAALSGIGGVFVLLVGILGIGFALLLAMLNVHYAAEGGRLTAYIEFGPALRRAFSKPLNTVVAAIVTVAVVAVTAVLGFIPFVGGAIGSFVGSLALANLWSQVYRLGR